MKLRLFISFCLSLFFCSALASTNQFTKPADSIVVQKANPQFTITLASNPTTGYSWHLLNYDKQLMTLVNHSYEKSANHIPGAGGKESWSFQVNNAAFIASHVSKITLLYARPWNIKENSKQLEFTIVTQ